MRIINGTALYTTNLFNAIPTLPPYPIVNTQFLLPTETSATTYRDTSLNNTVITFAGTPTWVSTSTPYVYNTLNIGSLQFNGTTDFLSFTGNANLVLGVQDWTVEFWVYLTALPAQTTILDLRGALAAVPATFNVFGAAGSPANCFTINDGTAHRATTGITPAINTWYHVVYSKVSGTLRILVNGVVYYSAADAVNYSTGNNAIWIGRGQDVSTFLSGSLTNLRISRGVGFYTASTAAPVAPLTTGTSTQLLLSVRNGPLTLTATDNGQFADSSFNNFIFYSSATERLENFKYKIELLEYYTAQSASAALLSGSASITNAADYNNLYTNLIGGMDQFEQYLYYDSSSTIFTHDIPLASPIVEFVTGSYIEPSPKSNNVYPYELYSITSSNFESWYTGVYSSASIYDTRNNNRLIRSIPEFMLLDENNEQLSTFVNMLGQHYDILYTYINAMTLINSRDEHPKKSMPNELLYSVAKQFGWNLTNGNQSKELWEYTLGTDVNGIPLTGSNSVGDPSVPSREVTYNIWRRIVNNIPGLLKAKGTKRSVQALLACYGVPQSLITIQEYGGPRIARPPTYEKLNFDYALDLIKNTTGIVRTDYNQNIGAVELRFRTDNVLKNPILPGTMNLFSAGGHDVTLEFSRGTMGKIQVNGTSSAEIEMFEGDYLTALLRTGSNNTVEVLANKSKYGKIINTVSASATGSFSNPGTVLIGGTSGGSRLQGHVQELRIWTGSLNNAPFNNHTKAPSAYDGNVDAYQELVFRTPLTQNINHALTSSLTGVQPDVKLIISASFTGSGYPAWTNSTPYDSIEETYYFDGISLGAGTFDDNKIRLESQTLTNTLNVENRATLNQFDTAPLDSNKLGIYYSPQTMINEDIIAQLGFTLLDDLIGDPTNNNRYSYPDLINTSREYWKKYADKNDMNAFLRIFSLFDLSFFKQLEQLLPARTEKILGLLIQPTIIERSKDSTLARISKLNQTYSGSIDIEKVINVTASKDDKNTSIDVIKETALSGSVKTSIVELEEKTANKIKPILEEFVRGIQENDLQNDKNPIEIINQDFIESSKLDEIGGIDIARNSVLSITGSYAAYQVIVETREDPFVGSTYSRKYLIQSGSTYIVGYTPYWESEAIVPFITASRVSEFLQINYSSSIGTTRRKAHVQDFLPTGIANHRFNGCKITSPDFNVNSKDTPDGKPVVEIAENNGNRIFTQPPGIKGNFDVRE